MMKNRIRLSIAGIFLLLTQILPAQEKLNVDIVSHTTLGESGNDIWAYIADDGTEYAIVGARTTTRIFDISDPVNPVEVAAISGSSSTWRDMKTYNDRIYVTCDQGNDGLLIINMAAAKDSITHNFWKPSLTVNEQAQTLRTCHNIYIDTTTGHAYLAGCNVGVGGALILDLKDNPDDPIHVGTENEAYSHDAFVNKGLLFTSEIYKGEGGIYDVSDPANPTFINSVVTSTLFTHNAWTNDEATVLFTTDEKPFGKIDAFDISNLNDIKFLSSWEPEASKDIGVIPHNTHYKDGFLYTSWYTEGIRITDVHDPSNIIEVGYYDPVDNFVDGFHGSWGTYPWLPSGNLIVSDIEKGLYVLQVYDNFGNEGPQRASYLRGNVTDIITGDNIPGASIEILCPQLNIATTDATGSYKTGSVYSGDYQVVFSHPQYDADTVWTTLVPGEYAVLDVALGNVNTTISVENTDAEKIIGARGLLINNITGAEKEVVADENGSFNLKFASNGSYDLLVGNWGYKPVKVSFSADSLVETVIMEPGYQDDFFVDLGWSNIGNAATGNWEIGVPESVIYSGRRLSTDGDITDDLGGKCLVTEVNIGSLGAEDIDDGEAIFLSPEMDFTGNKAAKIRLDYFYVFLDSDLPFDDAFSIWLINDTEEVELFRTEVITQDWTELELLITDEEISFSEDMQLVISATDVGNPHFTEAQVDGLTVELSETGFSSVDDVTQLDLNLYPNPVRNVVNLQFTHSLTEAHTYVIYDQSGRPVQKGVLAGKEIPVDGLEQGVYTLQLMNTAGQVAGAEKFVKL